jgi:hypothetical protein
MEEWEKLVKLAEGLERQLEDWSALLMIAAIISVGFLLRSLWAKLGEIYEKIDEISRKAESSTEQLVQLRKIRGQVPQSVTFSFKILQIPTLQEVGIPLSGLGTVKLNEAISGKGYAPSWINRGDPLFTYYFHFFSYDEGPKFLGFLGDPMRHYEFEIVSPISGLLISMREEEVVNFTVGLRYEWCGEDLLPVILVPNDEPPPDTRNFYEYDRMASYLCDCFNMLPIRDRSKTNAERLRDWIARKEDDFYPGLLSKLHERDKEVHRSYEVRELTSSDSKFINMVQNLRSKDPQLREKLVHIARKFGESI